MQDTTGFDSKHLFADPGEILHREHGDLLRLFRAIPVDPSRRPAAIALFISELTAHLRAEEEMLYPLVAKRTTTIEVHLQNLAKLKAELAKVAAGDWSCLPRIRRL